MDPRSAAETRSELKSILAKSGVRAALVFLNSLTRHRFTSFFRFDGPMLRSVTFYDRDNPAVEKCEDILVDASYCIFVRDTCARFTVADTSSDERVKDHPKRATVQRYCGVPMLDNGGKMFGTICHFDFEPGSVENAEVALLEHMADLLQPAF
jgi:GAF domain-containing protein